jgi:formate dehydrogenase iron-sulfur subunit
MSHATLIDTTKCIGCRSCQVTCKQWNGNAGEKTQVRAGLGLQNPVTLSAKTFALVTSTEVVDETAPGGLHWVFTKRQCMHCEDPACASACPVTALHKGADGKVTYDEAKCIGCRYCMWACPFGAPTAEWDSLAPRIRKCTMCADRESDPHLAVRNDQPLTDEDRKRYAAAHAVPACVKQCPAGALEYGDRTALLAKARERIARAPERYHAHVYGEQEAGGTNMLYLTAVPPQELGLPAVGTESYAARSKVALGAVPPAVVGVGAALGAVYALGQRRAAVAVAEGGHVDAHPHVEFAPAPSSMKTPANMLLGGVMAFGFLSFLARFVLGLGKSTNLSDTWAWGLWIVFDLTWIAVAAGAFATAGLIYVFRRKDLYGLGRSAVLMGLLSYSFVTITLLADLGLPWHAWQLGLQAPEHSAMFEVSWCVGLYVTILAYEFMPVPLEHYRMTSAMAVWRKWSPAWVVFAVTLFVWVMSRKLAYAGAAFAVFALLAWAFRSREGEKPVPVMLAIAAVTLSTMHQSSLGSLFLLMPDKLSHLWWSPVMPLLFFLSSVAAGTALMVVVEFWIAKGFDRAVRIRDAAAMGKIAFWALAVYQTLRFGDLALRGQLSAGTAGWGVLVLELGLGGLVPLVLLGSAKLRQSPALLLTGAALSTAGIVLNRVSVVALGMKLKGPMPQIAAVSYSPSLVEWGISAGLVAATIFLFAWGVRVLPILPKEERQGH